MWSCVAENSPTGTVTSPNVITPVQIARAMAVRSVRPCRAAGAFAPFHAGTPRAAPRAGRGSQGNGGTGGHRAARANCPNSR
ncbi:hypothetical protein GCM10010216_53300 [Streptomyces flaveolus]|nr:hypothetical protein GCM10010216_53300 [Streptomyces flaveolus]